MSFVARKTVAGALKTCARRSGSSAAACLWSSVRVCQTVALNGRPALAGARTPPLVVSRHYSAGAKRSAVDESVAPVVDYAKMAEIVRAQDPSVVIVDAREPDEYAAGHIQGAINIPVNSAPGALGLHEDEFKLQFGFDKPDAEKTLVFYCLAGVRSTMAEELAYTFGYSHRLNYAGSLSEWVKRGAPVVTEEQPAQV